MRRPASDDSTRDGEGRSRLDSLVDRIAEDLQAGRAVDIDAHVADNPSLETPLRDAFDSLQVLYGLPEDDDVLPAARELGDFRLIREIGRGGMGIVYEAEQLSLGRTVALKVLPFASVLDEKRRRRFHNEARAAASLDHPHIVPVHGSGCHRGVHYYAMRLIEGHSLAEVVAGLRRETGDQPNENESPSQGSLSRGESLFAPRTERPVRGANSDRNVAAADTSPIARLSTQHTNDPQSYYRTVAQLGVEAASALQYAHDEGVIHRDIKPANLMVDEHGKVWITDFGLAHLESDDLTVSGDFLGTLRYMSPEQATRSEPVVDHRTDIYSLGVTLYELVTLAPAIDGTDRQEMMRQIEEHPVLPRKHDPRVPPDLETILLKAMSTWRDDRYQSARELAEDLRRFTEKKPILARRSSRLRHSVSWIRRHRRESAVVGLLLMLLLTLAIGGPLFAWRYASIAAAERDARDQADATRKNLQRLLSDTLVNVNQALEDVPNIDDVHRDLWNQIIAQYEYLLSQTGDDPDVRFEAGVAFRRLSWVTSLRFDPELSRVLLEKAIAILNPLADEYANNGLYRLELVEAYRMQGSQFGGGQAVLQKATDMMERLYAADRDSADYVSQMSVCYVFLGAEEVGLRQLRRAEQHLSRGVELAEELVKRWPDFPELNHYHEINSLYLAFAKGQLANCYFVADRLPEAEVTYRDALQTYGSPHELRRALRYWIGYAADLGELGRTLTELGKTAEAAQSLRESVRQLEEIVAEYPGTSWAESTLVRRLSDLQGLLIREDELAEANATLERLIDFAKDRSLWPWTEYQLGHVTWATQRVEEARTFFLRSIEHCRERAKDKLLALILANCPDLALRDTQNALRLGREAFASATGREWQDFGIVLYRAEQWHEALDAFQRSIAPIGGGSAFDFFFLAMTCHQLGDHEAAEDWLRQANQRLAARSGHAERSRIHELLTLQAEVHGLLSSQTSETVGGDVPRDERLIRAYAGELHLAE